VSLRLTFSHTCFSLSSLLSLSLFSLSFARRYSLSLFSLSLSSLLSLERGGKLARPQFPPRLEEEREWERGEKDLSLLDLMLDVGVELRSWLFLLLKSQNITTLPLLQDYYTFYYCKTTTPSFTPTLPFHDLKVAAAKRKIMAWRRRRRRRWSQRRRRRQRPVPCRRRDRRRDHCRCQRDARRRRRRAEKMVQERTAAPLSLLMAHYHFSARFRRSLFSTLCLSSSPLVGLRREKAPLPPPPTATVRHHHRPDRRRLWQQ